MQNMRKGRRKMHRVGKVGIAYVQKRKWLFRTRFPISLSDDLRSRHKLQSYESKEKQRGNT